MSKRKPDPLAMNKTGPRPTRKAYLDALAADRHLSKEELAKRRRIAQGKDIRSRPKFRDPMQPAPAKKYVGMTPQQIDAYQRDAYNRNGAQARKTRVKARLLDRTKTLPPICGAPLDRPKPAGSDLDNLTPKEILLYGIQDTYLNICTARAGLNTNHMNKGYCAVCERAILAKLTSRVDGKGPKSQAKRKANNIMTAADLRKTYAQILHDRDILGQPVDIGPHEALMGEVQRTAGSIEWVLQLIKAMGTANGVRAESTPRKKPANGMPAPHHPAPHEVLTQMSKMGLEPSALYQILQWERDHLVQVSRAAIACGVAERKVRMAEEQGRMLVLVIQAFIHDPRLNLSPQQLNMAPAIVREHLLAMPRESSPELYLDRLATGQTTPAPIETTLATPTTTQPE